MLNDTANLLGVVGLSVADRIQTVALDVMNRAGETPESERDRPELPSVDGEVLSEIEIRRPDLGLRLPIDLVERACERTQSRLIVGKAERRSGCCFGRADEEVSQLSESHV